MRGVSKVKEEFYRHVDSTGRFMLPKAARKIMGIDESSKLAITMDGDTLCIRKCNEDFGVSKLSLVVDDLNSLKSSSKYLCDLDKIESAVAKINSAIDMLSSIKT